MRLTYPEDFPGTSRAKVDAAIEAADIAFLDNANPYVSQPGAYYDGSAQIAREDAVTAKVKSFITTGFFAFVDELCAIAPARGWDLTRIDEYADRFFQHLASHAYFEKTLTRGNCERFCDEL